MRRPTVSIHGEVRAGDLRRPLTHANLVAQLPDHCSIGLPHFTQPQPRADHVAVGDLLGADDAGGDSGDKEPSLAGLAPLAALTCVIQSALV